MDARYSELLNQPTISVQETADVLGLNHKTVREAIADGTLLPIRLGRTIRVPTSAVCALLGL